MEKKLLLLSTLALCSCSGLNSISNPLPQYSNHYEETKSSSLLFSYKDILYLNDEDYLLYFYSSQCLHCKAIKEDIAYFINRNIYPFFQFEIKEELPHSYNKDEIDKTIGSNNYLNVWVGVTPQLSKISEHKVSQNIIGDKEIITYLYSL